MKKPTAKKSARATAARATIKSKTAKSSKAKPNSLKLLNIITSVLMAAQAAALVVLADKDKGDVVLTANYFSRDPAASAATGQTVMTAAADSLANFNLVYLVAAGLLIGGLLNLLLASRYRLSYEADVKAGHSKWRWLGYGLVGSVVTAAVALVIGLTDIVGLALLASLLVVCFVAATYYQRMSAPRPRWLYRLSAAAGLAVIAALGLYVVMAHIYGGGLPYDNLIIAGVYAAGLLVAALAIGNTYKAKAGANQFLAREKAHLLFSFLVPSVVAWTIFGLLFK